MDNGPILICYESSEEARNAIGVAAGLIADREAIVVTVAPLEIIAEGYAELGSGGAALERELVQTTITQATEGAEIARRAGLEATVHRELETPTWRGLVEAAEGVGADVIVIASRGLRSFAAIAEGSVSRQMLRHSHCPVLVVPPPRADGSAAPESPRAG